MKQRPALGALFAFLALAFAGGAFAAANGAEALQMAEKFTGEINLLVTDVVMPQITGGELAELLLRSRPQMRLLFVSGYPDDLAATLGVSQGKRLFSVSRIHPARSPRRCARF